MPNVAIVGATGAVGELIRQVLEERNFPVESIRFLASAKSAGKEVTFRGTSYQVEPLRAEAFRGVDLVLSSTPSSVSREFSPLAAQAGAIVVDNSSAWRMDPDVPLVVPEVNAAALRSIPKKIVANPNCVAIPLTVVLKPLHDLAGLKRVVVATYQSSSGKGAKGLADFGAQLAAYATGRPVPPPQAHRGQLAGNVMTLDWTLDPNGYTEEENKVMNETRKILGLPRLGITVTCVRVPVKVSHSEAVNIEFERPILIEQAREVLAKAPGVVWMDESQGQVPQPIHAEGHDEVFVGRIRRDESVAHGLNLWLVADNLRKGAASNAVQIAEELLKIL
jgi:aspartate-semialdehyde dehydrogenase